ncbi:MAG: S-layer homology domain-containing protein, partial [Clostridia bacterium]|nr:S-layer homology domain-containing protein [Clostridia bacterium]
MTKRFISIVLCLCMILSIAMPVGASVQSEYYTDVFTDDDYYSAVKYLYEHEIIKGTTDTTFSPNDNITRGQIVVAFWRMLNKPSPVGTVTQFSDVPSSSYFYDAVKWASSSGIGIVMGNGDGTFNPNGNITQQDMMVFL